MVARGDKVMVVKGVKIPKGTRGTAFWVGETKYGMRVGFKDEAGVTLWTALGNVEVLHAPATVVSEMVVPVADEKIAALMALAEVLSKNVLALEARVAVLEAAAAPAVPAFLDFTDPAVKEAA